MDKLTLPHFSTDVFDSDICLFCVSFCFIIFSDIKIGSVDLCDGKFSDILWISCVDILD